MNIPVAEKATDPSRVLLCFSHLRWNFVYQRPQHLLTRAARNGSVIYVEEPVYEEGADPHLREREGAPGVIVATPVLRPGTPVEEIRGMIDGLLERFREGERIGWYYTPMALAFSDHLDWDICVYDCMDELSAFRDPPPRLREFEDALFNRADLVFTGGYSLYEAKRRRHPAVFAFSSSVEAEHFAAARAGRPDPEDQRSIPHPRVGFFGVIDERMDLGLVAHAAASLPDAQFVMLGPVVKIDPASLPQAANLHWLGGKSYAELPDYMANWAAGWMPFALNELTRFISPTKTPEFLAAGLPVVSTAVPDVIRGYASDALVTIADWSSIGEALRGALAPPDPAWLAKVERRIAEQSWDKTWAAMREHLRRMSTAPAQTMRLHQKGA